MSNWFDYENSKNLKGLAEKYSIGWAMGWELNMFPADPERYLTSLFLAYAKDCSGRRLILEDLEAENEDERWLNLPYTFRGCREYMGKQIAKFERLKDWIIENDRQFLHLTFSPQSTQFDSITDCLFRMKKNRNTLLQYLRDRGIENLEYVWVMEPHESGYPHFHILVFAPWIPEIEKLGEWWEDKGLGKYNGVDWEGAFDPQRSEKVVGYLTKYVSKQYGKKALGEEYEQSISTDGNLANYPEVEDGNKKLLFWSALLWITRSRSWSCSQGVSEAMRGEQSEPDVVSWACKGQIISRFVFVGSLPEGDLEVVEEVFDGNFRDYFSSLGYG